MKKLIILALGLFTVVSCKNDDDTGLVEEKVEISNKKEKSDLEKEGLNGEVKSVRQIIYDAVLEDGKIVKGYVRDSGLDNYERVYDANGNKIKETLFYEDGEVQETNTFTYNSFNQVIESTNYDGAGRLRTKTSFGYNENQKLIKIYEVGSDGNQNTSTVFNYNEDGKKSEELVYDYTNQLDYKLVFTYKDGKKSEEARYDYNNELVEKTFYTYNSNGNLVEEKKYEGEELLDKFVYAYNQKGQKILYERYEGDGTLGFRSTYEYDEKGNVVKEGITTPGEPEFVTTRTFTYEKGNWINKVEYEDGEPLTLTERTITYY